MSVDTVLEIARFGLGGGLVISNIAVWYGVWLERDSAPLAVQQKGWGILVRGLAAETAIGFLVFALDTSIGVRQSNEVTQAQTTAANAVLEAGRLGVSQKNLHDFVINQENLNFAAREDLQRSTTGLNKARDDAVTAANNAKADIAKAEDALAKETAIRDQIIAMTAPRTILPDKQSPFVQSVKPFAGLTVNVLTPVQNDADAGPLGTLLAALLTQANWKVGTGTPGTGWSKMVLVCAGDHPSEKVGAAAKAIVLMLRSDGIQSFIDTQLGPDIPMSGFGATLPKPDMTILVGAKQ